MKPQYQLSLISTRWSMLLLGLCAFLFLQSCSTTSRTANATYYPYGNSSYSTVYTPPSWAPTTAGLNLVRYYYLPDCDAYYDASSQQFFSQNVSGWVASSSVPTSCSNLDLSTAYTIMLNSNTAQPWLNNTFYQSNYPPQSYNAYGSIVLAHNLISGIPSGYSLSPRGFNENSNSVIFTERAADGTVYAFQNVPMTSISTYMPTETHIYYYGGGYPSR